MSDCGSSHLQEPDLSDGHPASQLPSWVKAGAVFAVDGGTEKIIRVTEKGIDVVTWCAFGFWPIASFQRDLASGRITRPAIPARRTRRISACPVRTQKRGRVAEVAALLETLPLEDDSPTAVLRSALVTLQGLWKGKPVGPPDLIVVERLAYAGAYAAGLGPAVAFRTSRGRYPALLEEAQDAQKLLMRFSRWLRQDTDDLAAEDLRGIEHFVQRGLEAAGLIASPAPRRRGRPRGPGYDPRLVQFQLSQRWPDYQAGSYSARQAIRDVAQELVLEKKRIAAAWRNEDLSAVTLGLEDQEVIGRVFSRLEREYYRLPKLTEEDVARYQFQAALNRQLFKS